MLMVQGTTSDAGKTTLVAGLCRVLKNQNIAVAPFKPQNMALNSAVTADGGEIGRAQALQALACRIAPTVNMNPVLIKPSSDTSAQIIIHGKVFANMTAQSFHNYKPAAKKAVLDSFVMLCESYNTVIVEGAGSPAEINLRAGDIANMGFAEEVNCPVILIADIDKGGVFAHIVGTLALLSSSEQNRILGFVINRFRGDIALLQPGLDWLEQKTGKPVLAVLPYLQDFYLQAEDAIDQQQILTQSTFKVVIPVLPRISNHTDFDSLRLHPQVDLQFVSVKKSPPACDLIILPGSKNVCDDLTALKDHGWHQAIQKHLRYGGKLIGICGGYQMLGKTINDPSAVEGLQRSVAGFDLLPLNTTLLKNKALKNVVGECLIDGISSRFSGYEIHHGETQLLDNSLPRPIRFDSGEFDGCISDDNAILGTYVHGLFDDAATCDALIRWAGFESQHAVDVSQITEAQIERLASVLEQEFDFQQLAAALTAFNAKKLQSVL